MTQLLKKLINFHPRKKVKNIKHNGNITMEDIFYAARYRIDIWIDR